MPRQYYLDKNTDEHVCVQCEARFKERLAIHQHAWQHREQDGTLTAWDLHRTRRCARTPRICRYCHPVRRPRVAGEVEPDAYRKEPYSVSGVLTALLSNERRYRNKFSPKHMAQLTRAAKRATTLRRMIRGRHERRLKAVRDDDGRQTPYVAHAVDVACHATATCCRGCVARWHRFPKLDEHGERITLTDAQLDHLEHVVYTFVTQYVLPVGALRTWFQALPRTNLQTDYYYNTGRFLVTRGQLAVEK